MSISEPMGAFERKEREQARTRLRELVSFTMEFGQMHVSRDSYAMIAIQTALRALGESLDGPAPIRVTVKPSGFIENYLSGFAIAHGAHGQGEPIGIVTYDSNGYPYVQWERQAPPGGTKVYLKPPIGDAK